jgi:ADP-heptose:LPS heptosyltransferase
MARVRREKIDSVLDYELFARSSAVLAYLSGARRRVGFHSFHGDGPWRGDLMTHRLGCNPHLHMQTVMSVMVEALDSDPQTLPALDIDTQALGTDLMRFEPPAAERDEVARIIGAQGGAAAGRPLILLNANASDLIPLRKWDDSRYAEMARRILAEDSEAFVAFTGSPSEAAPIDALVRTVNHPRCFSLAGRTTMRQLLVLYTLADVLVSNDSGPGHFAALTDIDILTLVGPETPKVWGVLGPHAHRVSIDLPCSPCVSIYNNRLSSCRNNLCMQGITVEMVHRKVMQLLADRRRHAPG